MFNVVARAMWKLYMLAWYGKEGDGLELVDVRCHYSFPINMSPTCRHRSTFYQIWNKFVCCSALAWDVTTSIRTTYRLYTP